MIEKEQRLALSKSCGLIIVFLTFGVLFKQEQLCGVGNSRRGQMIEKNVENTKVSILSKNNIISKKYFFLEKSKF